MENSFLSSGNKETCYGCEACKYICPTGCISMVLDDEGFRYPERDSEKCIHCNKCENVCPKLHAVYKDTVSKKAYVYTADETTILRSSSGGAFSAIYSYYLERDYLVYGVKYGDNLQVIHDCAMTKEECELFRKSKYVQSQVNEYFEKIKKQVKEGRKILFSGTPCQCAALNNYLDHVNLDSKQVVTVSVLCHGVSNQMIFNECIRSREKAKKCRIVNYTFRYKTKKGEIYDSRCAQICCKDGKSIVVNRRTDAYLKGYYSRLFYRPSCGKCQFASPNRVSDYTIGDAWGIESLNKEMKPLRGVSLVLINTEESTQIASYMSRMGDCVEVPYEWAVDSQKIFRHPVEFHKNRTLFFDLRRKGKGIEYAVNRATYKPVWKKIVGRLLYYKKKLLQ